MGKELYENLDDLQIVHRSRVANQIANSHTYRSFGEHVEDIEVHCY